MIVSFFVALAFEFIIPNNFSVEEKLIIGFIQNGLLNK